ncbi:MAG: RNA polymerase sigma factor [Candidatus Staskawiczbacteria bacterium]|jgi:RNA polymerase sigma-70 factor (ECF subfamily)
MANKLEKTFSKLYDQNIDKIYRFVFLKVNSKETAEDLTSKVFMRGWDRFRQGVDNIDNPRAFLYQIARNTVIDYYREKGRANTVSIDNAPQIADPRVNLHERAAINADLAGVKQALSGLSDDYQNVVIWHYLDDLPIKEVAKLLDRSEEATRVLLHRALGSLRERLTS